VISNHPFEIGHVVTLTHLQRKLGAPVRGVVAQLHRLNRVYRDDVRFAGAWPVARVAGGELVYFDRRFYRTICSETGLPDVP
jgi:hypothetical protein